MEEERAGRYFASQWWNHSGSCVDFNSIVT
jgi:hypothetical protein